MGFIDEVRLNARDINETINEQELFFRETVIGRFKKAVLATAQEGVKHGFVSGQVSVRQLSPEELRRDFYNYGYKNFMGFRKQQIQLHETAIRIALIVRAFAQEENIRVTVCLEDPIYQRSWNLDPESLEQVVLKIRRNEETVSINDGYVAIRYECQL